jgi:UDP-N-acetylglucosamine diphosphorylase/glucosamine-1-phosphate N-acetyltransferase
MSGDHLVIHDDARARTFEPFALTRPIGTLTSGVAAIADRWSIALGVDGPACSAARHLTDFDEDLRASASVPAGSIVASSRFAPSLAPLPLDSSIKRWTSGGRVVAVRVSEAMSAKDLAKNDLGLGAAARGETHEVAGWWHDEVWDFIRHLPAILTDDIRRLGSSDAMRARFSGSLPDHATVIGDHPILVDPGSHLAEVEQTVIEPHVVFDASTGPILIESGVHIRAFTRITGPCRIGHRSTIVGGDITGCSIGPVCKIRGEISSSIVLGYSNKGHEGFVGHSYLGRWVNLGAGTTTSNLKNTYGSVSLWTPEGIRDTGLQFLGTMFGDRVKTGIGLMLTTGTVLGAGANVYGSSMPPKVVPPFAWGDGEPYDVYRLDKFLSSAEIVMARRHMTLSDRAKKQLGASFERRWTSSEESKTQSGRPSVPAVSRGKSAKASQKASQRSSQKASQKARGKR